MALPPVLASQDNSSWPSTMPLPVPIGYAAPISQHAPTAATDQGGAALVAAMEQLEKQRLEATAERKEMREELAEARAEISRLRDLAAEATAERAEMRKDLDNARWGNSWGSAGWWTRGPQ